MSDLPKPGAAVKRDRVLTNTELAAVWGAAEKAVGPFGPAIRLLALTAARRDEIASMRWSEVHGDESALPAERSKNGEPHMIAAPAAAKLIQDAPRIGDDGFVFTTTGKTPVSGWSKAKRALDAAAAELYGRPLPAWRLHDLRRTAATGMQRLGVGLQTVESHPRACLRIVLALLGSISATVSKMRSARRLRLGPVSSSASHGSGEIHAFEPPTAEPLVLGANNPDRRGQAHQYRVVACNYGRGRSY